MEAKYGYCITDAEQFCTADSINEAHGEAQTHIDEGFMAGEEVEYEIFEVCPAVEIALGGDKSRQYLAERIVEQVDEWAADETGAEDETFDLSGDEMKELGDMVANFILLHANSQWFGVKPGTKQKFLFVAGSNGDSVPVAESDGTA